MRQKLNAKGKAQPTGRGADRGWGLVVGCSAAVFRQVIRSDNGASLPHIIWTTDGAVTRWMLCEVQFAAPWSRHWRCGMFSRDRRSLVLGTRGLHYVILPEMVTRRRS